MKILIAVEDKQFTDAIAEFVCNRQTWSDETEFRIIHVVEPLLLGPVGFGAYPADVLANYVEERHRAGRSLVLSIGTEIRQHYPSAPITEQVLDGHPKQVIIDTATSWKADLIVVGSHGRSGLSKFLLGSVSMSVLSIAPCSVLIVKLPPATPSKQEKATAETAAESLTTS